MLENEKLTFLNSIEVDLPKSEEENLLEAVEQAVERRKTQRALSDKPSHKQQLKQVKRIVNRCKELTKELDFTSPAPDGKNKQYLKNQFLLELAPEARKRNTPVNHLLSDLIESVATTETTAANLQKKLEEEEAKRYQQSQSPNPRNSRTRHMISWINDLSEIYRQFVDSKHEKPTYTWDDYNQVASGKFLNFLHAAEQCFFSSDMLSKLALADHIKKTRKYNEE